MSALIPFNRNNQNLSAPRHNSFYNMLDDFFSDPWPMGRSLFNDTFKMDVRENDKEYSIEAELPGVKKEEINLTVDEGRFTITVNREETVSNDGDAFVHRERHTSSMSRSIYLADADGEAVNAKLEDGVLKIVVPKAAPIETRKSITIQ
jgi:HSP20 family protein